MGNLFCGMRFCTKIAESRLDSAISQNLNQNNSVRSTQTRPLRGAKNREQGRSSATADFLLEAEKRGSPPKSEKRQLLGTHFKKVGGSDAGGAALLREKSSKSKSKKIANNSQIAKIDCFGQNPRNDGFFDSTNHTHNDRFILKRSKF